MKSPLQAFPTRRFWVAIFALVSLGVMGGGLKYYQYEQDHIRREKYQELAAIADLKVRQILEWRRERLDDANRIARSPFLRKAIMDWLQDPSTPGLRTALLEQFKSEEIEGYGNVLLADLEGRILLSILPDPAPLSPSGKQALEAAVAGRQAVAGDLFRCPKDDRVHLDVTAPVLDPRGQPLAVVVLKINPDRILYPLIQSWPTPSLTAETLLVEVEGKDILFLNELRHREKTALSLREPLTQKDLPAEQAGLGKQGVFEGRDYRDKKVLADLRPVPQSPWFMVAKVDADEILAEARYRAGITGLFVVIFILLTAAVTAYSYRQRQANLYQDLYQSEREQRQAQEEFRTTLYSIGDAVITTDTEGLVKHINRVAERLTGWLEAEARGKLLEEVFRIINEETRTAVENPAQRVLREGVVVGLANHTLLIARDGTESPIADSGAPIRDETGAVIGVVLVFRDQTEERAAQNALRESEEHYRSLFDNMLNGFAYCKMLFDQNQAQDFIYLNVNNSFEELTGLKNVVGKRVSEVIPGIRESDPELFEIYGRVALTGKPERLETYVEALKMWFSISVYSPEKEYFVAVFDIITERKRAEEALKENMRLNQILLDAFPCVALLLRPQTRDIIASNAAAVKVGAVPGTQCFSTWGQRQDPCPWCLAPAVWATGEAQHLEVEALGIFWDAYWIPVAEDLYMHFAFDITDRKRGEEALANNYSELYNTTQQLEQSRNMLQLIIESIPVRVFWKDRDFRFMGCNTLFARDAGLSQPEQLLGKDDFSMGWGEHAEEYRADDRQVMESRRPKLNIVEPQTTPTGAKIWLNTSKVPLQMPNGEVFGVLGVYEDITERKRAEETVLKYEFIANTANDYMTLINRNYIYEAANAVFCKAHGKTREEVVGTSLAYIWGEDRFKNYIKGDLDRCFTGQTVESVDWFKFGKMGRGCYHGSYTPYFNEDGTVAYAAVVSHDITARKRDEESLRESEEKFRLVFEKAPLGIMHYDQTSTITDCNEKFAEIIGAPKEKFIGFNMMQQLRDDKMREAVAVSLKGEVGYYEDDYLSVTAAKLTPVRAIYQPIFSSDGVLSGGVALFEDIGERKRAELARLQFSKLESLGSLAGGIAHDFNNILTAILGNIGLAALDDKIGPRVKDRLAQAEAACLRAQVLSRQLLTFAKGGAPVKKIFSVPELLTETTVFACVGSPVKCETTFPENLWSIEADPGQIGQVFQNLTINAIQAMPTGGTIKVWAENLTLGTKSDLPLSAGRYIKISVRDQGMGIPAEHFPRIFDPYFTTKQKGSGLGLASAYAIINKHHGHIAVESKPGVGTTFYIYFPAVDQQVTPQPAEDRELLVGKGKILVMDDEEMVREVLGRMLARLGYEAEFARDGGEAIEMFVQAHGFGQTFAAVILDLTVPGAMGGKETMARLLEIDPQVKVIVSSGYSDDPIMADFQKYGFSGVIAKPYKISELGKILNQVIMKKA